MYFGDKRDDRRSGRDRPRDDAVESRRRRDYSREAQQRDRGYDNNRGRSGDRRDNYDNNRRRNDSRDRGDRSYNRDRDYGRDKDRDDSYDRREQRRGYDDRRGGRDDYYDRDEDRRGRKGGYGGYGDDFNQPNRRDERSYNDREERPRADDRPRGGDDRRDDRARGVDDRRDDRPRGGDDRRDDRPRGGSERPRDGGDNRPRDGDSNDQQRNNNGFEKQQANWDDRKKATDDGRDGWKEPTGGRDGWKESSGGNGGRHVSPQWDAPADNNSKQWNDSGAGNGQPKWGGGNDEKEQPKWNDEKEQPKWGGNDEKEWGKEKDGRNDDNNRDDNNQAPSTFDPGYSLGGLDDLVDKLNDMTRPAPAGLVPFKRNFYIEHPKIASMTADEASNIRAAQDIRIIAPSDPTEVAKPIISFKHSPFNQDINDIMINEKKFKAPTPIQQQGWPIALSGKDLIGIAETGSGKTLAFILPAIVHIKAQPELKSGEGPIALVLAPTRELAQQIGDETKPFAEAMDQTVLTIYGQMQDGIGAKRKCREGVHILVACPGKLMDFLGNKIVNLSRVTYFVLDEADRLLEMGFKSQVDAIDRMIREDRQILMWSATWPRDVQNLVKDIFHQRNIDPPVHIRIGSGEGAVNTIKQNFIQTRDKYRDFFEHMERTKHILTLVFVQTKRAADDLEQQLPERTNNSVFAAKLHGDCDQPARTRAINSFKKKEINCLIATEVAARGLDVNNIGQVVIFDCPQKVEDYIHRIGRTGRAGRSGESFTFIEDGDSYKNSEFFSKIIPCLQQNNQEIPDWFRDMAQQCGGGGFSRSRYGNVSGGGYNSRGNDRSGGGGGGGWNDSKNDAPSGGGGGWGDSKNDGPSAGGGGWGDSKNDGPSGGGGGWGDSKNDGPSAGGGGWNDSKNDGPSAGGGGGWGDSKDDGPAENNWKSKENNNNNNNNWGSSTAKEEGWGTPSTKDKVDLEDGEIAGNGGW